MKYGLGVVLAAKLQLTTLTSLFVLGVLDVSIDVSQFYIPSLYLSIFLSIFCCYFPF